MEPRDEVTVWLESAVQNRILRTTYQQRWQQWAQDLPDAHIVASWLVRSAEHPSLRPWILSLFEQESLPSLLTIIAYSPFLAQRILAHPRYFKDLFQTKIQVLTPSRESWFESLERFLLLHSGLDIQSAFALFRDRSWARILAADILRQLSLAEVTEQLSLLADVIVTKAFMVAASPSSRASGVPAVDGSSKDIRFAVLALGKWGGMELNYSSDIDLMIVAEPIPGLPDSARPEIMHVLQERVVRALDLIRSYTPYGRPYRVDLRLRPLGHEGEVVIPSTQAERYYTNWADFWEKQALIKLRFVCGDAEFGRSFVKKAQTFLLPVPSFDELFQRLEALRQERFRQLGSQAALNVKEGPGGLRDIEFLVQILQWFHWEAHPIVRQANTLKALQILLDIGALTPSAFRILYQGYVFLRRCEHILQIEENRQVFELPRTPEDRYRFARKMGYAPPDPWRRFEQDYLLITRRVTEQWDHLRSLAPSLPGKSRPSVFEPSGELARQRWDDLVRDEPAMVAFANKPDWTPWFEKVLESPVFPDVRHHLLWTVKLIHDHPDLEKMLHERPGWHRIIQSLMVASPVLAESLWRYGELLTEPVVQRLFQADVDWGMWLTRGGDIRDAWPLTKRIRAMELVLAMLEFGQQLTLSQLWSLHSLKTEIILRSTATEHFSDYIEDTVEDPPSWVYQQPPVWIISLGRLGCREMDWGSDADIIVVFDNAVMHRLGISDPVYSLTRWVRRWMQDLGRWTRWGYLVDADLRLRPFGSSGELVHNASRVLDYFAHQARVWEMLSFLKGRLIFGNNRAFADWMRELQAIWQDRGWNVSTVKGEMKEMLKQWARTYPDNHLKFGHGGWMEWWFRVHLFQMDRGWHQQEFWDRPGSSYEWLRQMYHAGYLDDEEREGYERLFRFLHWWRLMGYKDSMWRKDRMDHLIHRLTLLDHPDLVWIPDWPEIVENLHHRFLEVLNR